MVGSSSSSASGRISRMRASATRIFQPPESCADVAVHHLLREAEAGEDLARPRLERVAAELVEARLHVAEALEQRVQLVGARGIGQRLLELLAARRRPRTTAPAPAIISATTVRPAISPTSWLK